MTSKKLLALKSPFFGRTILKFGRWHRKTIGHFRPLLYDFYFKLCASFQNHQTISELKLVLEFGNAHFGSNRDCLSRVTLTFEGWHWIGHLFYATLSLKFKLCASFRSHQWIQTWVTVQTHSILVKIGDFFVPYDLEIWRMTFKNNSSPLLLPYATSVQTLVIIS